MPGCCRYDGQSCASLSRGLPVHSYYKKSSLSVKEGYLPSRIRKVTSPLFPHGTIPFLISSPRLPIPIGSPVQGQQGIPDTPGR